VPSALPPGDPAPPDGRLPEADLAAARDVPFGVYVHIPFCRTRCGYCDFNTYTATELGSAVSQAGYADTLLHEVRLAADVLDGLTPPVSTVFFGGGTPTLLPAEHLGLIIAEIGERFGLAPDVEITTEANPETVSPGYLGRLREAGFTRVSVGMQSAVPRVLAVLDRQHRPGRPEQVVAEARAAGFDWYEVSNWATSTAGRCHHNELYWRDANWWGFGPGAHSHLGSVRWWNVKHPARYATVLESGASPAAARETLDARARYTERVMLGVRLREGLPVAELPDAVADVPAQLVGWGLVDRAALGAGRLVLTQRGRLMADAVTRELLS